MDVGFFVDALINAGISFFTGVPDSQLSQFCDEIARRCGSFNGSHITAHNEGGAVALASGHYLATGEVPCVYLQNSGLGNLLNPVASLTHSKVYGIPILYIVGWRGEPGTADEPQHIFQGEITLPLLETLEIECCIIDEATTIDEIESALVRFEAKFAVGESAAFVVRKGAFSGSSFTYGNSYTLNRENAIGMILDHTGSDPVVSTTGKISRELFELRHWREQSHACDFLSVGSMGHCLMIALGIALEKPERRVWCIDGDGSILMHMGSLAVVGCLSPDNLIHIVLNNAAHETVGGMPTAAQTLDFPALALACGYNNAYVATDESSLYYSLAEASEQEGPTFIEAQVSLGSRSDLGRPTTGTHKNKEKFMKFLEG